MKKILGLMLVLALAICACAEETQGANDAPLQTAQSAQALLAAYDSYGYISVQTDDAGETRSYLTRWLGLAADGATAVAEVDFDGNMRYAANGVEYVCHAHTGLVEARVMDGALWNQTLQNWLSELAIEPMGPLSPAQLENGAMASLQMDEAFEGCEMITWEKETGRLLEYAYGAINEAGALVPEYKLTALKNARLFLPDDFMALVNAPAREITFVLANGETQTASVAENLPVRFFDEAGECALYANAEKTQIAGEDAQTLYAVPENDPPYISARMPAAGTRE